MSFLSLTMTGFYVKAVTLVSLCSRSLAFAFALHDTLRLRVAALKPTTLLCGLS